jgi:uncharacterized protein (DUF58 family)
MGSMTSHERDERSREEPRRRDAARDEVAVRASVSAPSLRVGGAGVREGRDKSQGGLKWSISPSARAAALFAVAVVITAALTRRGELVALAVPLLLWLTVAIRAPRPDTTVVAATPDPPRCRELDEVELTLAAPDDGLAYRGELLVPSQAGQPELREARATSWRVRMPTWGTHTLRIAVQITPPGGAWQARVRVAVPVVVTPRGVPGTAALRGSVRRPSYGERVARVAGAGTEFLDVAQWRPGQPLRRVHWAATMRTGEIHVARMAADRSQDVVLVVDARSEAGPPGATSVDRATRAAVALAEAHLRAGDRVALALASRHLRWVAPGTGTRQLVRIVDCLLEHRAGVDLPHGELEHIPSRILVPGALTVCLTALLSDESLRLVGDVRRRGHPTVVIDVLDHEPAIGRARADHQALRAWRLDRIAIRQHLARRGIVSVSWPGDISLPAALRPLAARPLTAGGRR